jgi:hypothetical protein
MNAMVNSNKMPEGFSTEILTRHLKKIQGKMKNFQLS